MVSDGQLTETTYFKETDRNAYIPLTSCHHPSWLKAAPKGQFQRIRRNCTNILDYQQQAQVLKSRFLDKGYTERKIDETIKNVGSMDREVMLNGSRRVNQAPDNKFDYSLVTGYSNQHFSVRKIFNKYWIQLKNDKVLGPTLPDHPVVIYRGVPSLRHSIVPNVVDPPSTISFFQTMKGFYPCRSCDICQINSFREQRCETFKSTQTNKSYNIESFITWSTA